MQRASAVHERWWTGLNVTFQTNGPTKRPLLCLKSWPKLTTTLNWLKAWKAHGDENRLPLSFAKSSGSRVLSEIAWFRQQSVRQNAKVSVTQCLPNSSRNTGN